MELKMTRHKKAKFNIKTGDPLLLGATAKKDGINFALINETDEKCSLILYSKDNHEAAWEVSFTKDMKYGNIYAMKIDDIDAMEYEYNFKIGSEIVVDRYAKQLYGISEWGKLTKGIVTAEVVEQNFDWEQDRPLHIAYEDTIIYRLHVRGFTKDVTSKAAHKGTFLGILDKIPYLKELGVTLIELMPAYNFSEVMIKKKTDKYDYNYDYNEDSNRHRINYWGYTKGNYFVPKSAYAFNPGQAITEFKQVVKALHANAIEVGMEFYFSNLEDPHFILDCLRYWVLEYHIDSLHVSANELTMKLLQRDALLSHTKIIGWGYDEGISENRTFKNLGSLNGSFYATARRFLKSDEEQLEKMAFHIKNNPADIAPINYIANHGTFTLMDLVSYDRKHNEINGENNNDGAEYNYSWNCGVEGPTKKKKVLELRKQQIKNALIFVLLSQGVPMIYAGDEYGNSQKGNNNAYCQDNPIGWMNWRENRFNIEIFQFAKELIAYRKAHPVLHMKQEMKIMDYRALGLPDMSYHGNKPWYADFNHVNRHFAVMYCGKYAALDGEQEDNDIYIAYNMHWEPQEFGMPGALEHKKWKVAITSSTMVDIVDNKKIKVPARSVVVLETETGE